MNTDIEKLLREAPQFAPPRGLKEKLIEQVQMPNQPAASRPSIPTPAAGEWLRRWWPALAPAAVSAACAVALTVQQGEIRQLKASNQALSQAAAAAQSNGAQVKNSPDATPAEQSGEMQQEINRLKELAARLKGEIGQLQQLKTENAALRAQVATPAGLALTPEETEELAKAKENAVRIACVNNLKQFGLAVRTWALDNNDSNPPNVLSMSNELSTPKVLFCPADTTRQLATDWASFTSASCSYEFLAPSENTDADPQRVLSRCPIHGNIGLCDGSVQSSVAKNHPEQLVERDGKLYLQPVAPSTTTPVNPTEEQMKKFRERYGLIPPNGTTTDQKP